MSGLQALGYGVTVTFVLMVALFFLSRLLMRFGLLPLSVALSASDINLFVLYLLILPGTVVHELSHYLACLLTQVRVREVKLFSPRPSGAVGWVIHDQVDPVRRNAIALAPFIGGSLVIYVLVRFGLPPGETDPLRILPDDLVQSFGLALTSVTQTLRAADLHSIATWLIFYVLFSLTFAVAPSNDDLGHLVADGLLAMGVIIFIKLVDDYYALNLAGSSVLNSAAAALAGFVQHLNALLLFACVMASLGALVLVPLAMLAFWLRSSLS